jgi:hypothetical protein
MSKQSTFVILGLAVAVLVICVSCAIAVRAAAAGSAAHGSRLPSRSDESFAW